jgi:hypothetical protein
MNYGIGAKFRIRQIFHLVSQLPVNQIAKIVLLSKIFKQ